MKSVSADSLSDPVTKFQLPVNIFSGAPLPDFKERLEQLAHALQIEDQELARVGGIVKQTFSKYKTGESQPRLDVLERWVRELRVNANWLLLGEGAMFRDEVGVSGSAETKSNDLTIDPVVTRAERIAALMAAHGAKDEEVREAIMASLRALSPQLNEPRPLYSVQEPEAPYDTK